MLIPFGGFPAGSEGQDLVPDVTSSLLQAVLSYPLVPIREPPTHRPHTRGHHGACAYLMCRAFNGCKCASQTTKGSCNCGSDCKCGGEKKSACSCSK
ncbi:hypothetical protein M5D96_000493 [Drosophila gunungcola]|uniref:Uncharacterized protein n=1 Tax=Drosophila gunungcola TaxID=103775 RepID=A0A9P9YWF3_9MUSC|nr:hypothetical protein M5D96_000493 [Drosophila gunungcola]